MKKCKTCKKEMEPTGEFFYLRHSTKDGLSSECKSCFSKRERERYKNRNSGSRPPRKNPEREQRELYCRVGAKLKKDVCTKTGFKFSATIDYILANKYINFTSPPIFPILKERAHLTIDADLYEKAKIKFCQKFGESTNDTVINNLMYEFLNLPF